MTLIRPRIVLFAVLGLLLTGTAPAQDAPLRTDHLSSRLVARTDAVVPGQPLTVGLLLEHDPHWHTYWRNPGDSGLPTKIRFELPDGFAAGGIDWPIPDRIPIDPLVNYGYSDRALLPVTIAVPDDLAGDEVTLRATASWLICEVECIPGDGEYTLTLPVRDAAGADPRWEPDFAWARLRQPESDADIAARYAVDGERVVVAFSGDDLPDDANAWTLFPVTAQVVANAAEPAWRRTDTGWEFTTTVSEYFADAPERFDLVLARDGEGFALAAGRDDSLAVAGAATTGSSPTVLPATAGGGVSLALALGFAFLGGIVLNLMPCVFPVLSIKAMGALQSSDDRAALRAHGLWYTAGLVVAFLAIAGALLALRGSGQALGWGFQLQEPAFVAAIALLLFAMALSFAGVIEFGASFAGVGQKLTEGHGARSAFFTGVLACIVASPCTAPFMGTALGFALTQPAWAALSVFVALALGMAVPMLVLGFVPGAARLLPRPGAWMNTFRQLLAFPLFLTVVWLLWVYGEQTSALGMAQLLAALTGLAFALWVFAHARTARSNAARVAWRAVAMASLAIAIGWPLLVEPPVAQASTEAASSAHEPWSAQRLAELRADGRPVLVNMTAAWCITCLANERVALSSTAVAQAMTERGIVYLKGDWTRRDDAITQYLESFGRSGVPLYVLYPAGGGEPVVLPQLLTPEIVVDALAQASPGR